MSGRMKVLVWHEPHQALFQFIKVLHRKVMQLIPERADAEFQTNDASLKFNVKVQRVASTLPLQAKVGVRLCALTSRFRPPPSRGCAVRQPPPWMRTVAAPPDCGNRADSWDIANFMHIYFKNGCVILHVHDPLCAEVSRRLWYPAEIDALPKCLERGGVREAAPWVRCFFAPAGPFVASRGSRLSCMLAGLINWI